MSGQSWPSVWTMIARAMAEKSSCSRAQIGAVIVDSGNRIVATGYNGLPANLPGMCATVCPRAMGDRTLDYDNCVAIHAEANALLFCDRRDREGGSIYVTGAVCYGCAKLIANSGLANVHMIVHDSDVHRNPAQSIKFLDQAGLNVYVTEVHA